ncbi:NADPH:quinone reductase [Pedobacter sp. ok626]|nr:NADPH:quinone reductase [Pedobacter sp. ok626]
MALHLTIKSGKMKAIILNDLGELHLETITEPSPLANELLIKIISSGFNPIDYQMRENEMERKLLHSPILGREFSGIVKAVGASATDFKIGDAVFCGSGNMGSNGTYAEYICVPETIVAFKPNSVSFEEAAGTPSAGLTALQCFNRMKVKKTDSLFISGATGAVGTMLIKILWYNGIQNFIVTAGNQESVADLMEIGLHRSQIINYKTTDIESSALSFNQQMKFDFVVDLVGNKMAETSARLVKVNGTYLDVTALSTTESREILFNNGTTILNISNYAPSLIKKFDYYQDGLNKIAELLEHGSIRAPKIEVIGALNVTTVEKAHQILRKNETKGRKLIMKIATV